MESFVLAVRENSGGSYIGFLEDHTVLQCSECKHGAEYRLRYTENEKGNLEAHRQTAKRMIGAEHPAHNNKIRVY